MKVKYKKKLRLVDELKIGDNIKVAGLLCVVMKKDYVFDYVPKASVRLGLQIVGAATSRKNSVLFLPTGTPVTVVT